MIYWMDVCAFNYNPFDLIRLHSSNKRKKLAEISMRSPFYFRCSSVWRIFRFQRAWSVASHDRSVCIGSQIECRNKTRWKFQLNKKNRSSNNKTHRSKREKYFWTRASFRYGWFHSSRHNSVCFEAFCHLKLINFSFRFCLLFWEVCTSTHMDMHRILFVVSFLFFLLWKHSKDCQSVFWTLCTLDRLFFFSLSLTHSRQIRNFFSLFFFATNFGNVFRWCVKKGEKNEMWNEKTRFFLPHMCLCVRSSARERQTAQESWAKTKCVQ